MDVRETLRQAVEMGASDIFIIAGLPLTYKVDGRQRRMEARLMPADTAAVISDIYTLCGRSRSRIEREDMDDDFYDSGSRTFPGECSASARQPCGGHSCDTFWLAGAGKAEHSA